MANLAMRGVSGMRMTVRPLARAQIVSSPRGRALARQRGELRLYQAERRRAGIASQEAWQQLRSKEAGITGEEQRRHGGRLYATARS